MKSEDSPRDSDLWMLIKDMRSEMAHLTQQREEDQRQREQDLQRSVELSCRNKNLETEVERLRDILLERSSQPGGRLSGGPHDMEEGTEENDDRYLYGTSVRQRAQFWDGKNVNPEEVQQVTIRQVSSPNRRRNNHVESTAISASG